MCDGGIAGIVRRQGQVEKQRYVLIWRPWWAHHHRAEQIAPRGESPDDDWCGCIILALQQPFPKDNHLAPRSHHELSCAESHVGKEEMIQWLYVVVAHIERHQRRRLRRIFRRRRRRAAGGVGQSARRGSGLATAFAAGELHIRMRRNSAVRQVGAGAADAARRFFLRFVILRGLWKQLGPRLLVRLPPLQIVIAALAVALDDPKDLGRAIGAYGAGLRGRTNRR
mmetsp:Transcript_59259/g.165455  ORF Transcript_59259/g.165455 Transcript_59259/m.165455 type:complete len:225 (-) Transcript_59259:1492-2166(-)